MKGASVVEKSVVTAGDASLAAQTSLQAASGRLRDVVYPVTSTYIVELETEDRGLNDLPLRLYVKVV